MMPRSSDIHLDMTRRDAGALRTLLRQSIEAASSSRLVSAYVRLLGRLEGWPPALDEQVRTNLALVAEVAEACMAIEASRTSLHEFVGALRANRVPWPPMAEAALTVAHLHPSCVSALANLGAAIVQRYSGRVVNRLVETLARRMDAHHQDWRPRDEGKGDNR